MKKMVMAVLAIFVVAGVISSFSDSEEAGSDVSYVNQGWTETDMDYGNNGAASYTEAPYGNADIFYDEPRDCFACGGSGISQYKCTWCDGSGIDPAYEATEGSVIHAFAQRDCAECSGLGYPPCMSCGGTGDE